MERRRIIVIGWREIPSREANTIQVMKMCQAFVRLGYTAELIVPQSRKTVWKHEELWRHYGITTPFEITGIPTDHDHRLYLYALRAAIRCLPRTPELILCRGANLTVALLSNCHAPTMIEFHDVPRGRLSSWYLRLFAGGRGARGAIAITQHLKDDLLRVYPRFFRDEDIVVCPDGVDLNRFDPPVEQMVARERLGLDRMAFVAGYVGHLYPGKGSEVLLPLAQACPSTQFIVVGGEARDIEQFRMQAAQMGQKNLNIYGFIPNADVPEYLAVCDVLLLPNQHAVTPHGGTGGDIGRYTSPMKIFEYMAAQRAILASDLPVLREVLDDSCALFAAPDDLAGWRQALERLKEDLPLRKQLAQTAGVLAKQYTWEHRAKLILSHARRKREIP